MAVTVLLLGPLRDMSEQAELFLAAPLDWAGLLDAVDTRIAELLQNDRVNVACAGKVLADKSRLYAKDGDEVALLPPVSGG